MLRSEGDRLVRVVVSSPLEEYYIGGDHETHNIAEAADRDLAIAQHGKLKSILENYECEVIDAPELPGHPNSVFTRDTAVCTPDGYIRMRMGLESRRGEEEWMAGILDDLGESCVGEIMTPGTVEGGDIIVAGDVAFVGRSSRMNFDGEAQLTGILLSLGYEIRIAPIPDRYLHIGGVMSLLGPGRILCCEGVFPPHYFKGFETIEVSGDSRTTGNVICLGKNRVIVESANTEVIETLKENGVKVHAIDLSEFAKGRGGPSCMIMPVERRP
jgi:dimethylargininase